MRLADYPRLFEFAALKKIVWAIDAFETDRELHRNAARTIQALIDKTGAEIEPVYVLSVAQLNLMPEVPGPWMINYRPAAEKALSRMLDEVHLPHMKSPHVILQKSSSSIESTSLISKYASSVQADLIVVTSHKRSGMSRLFLGSFAETLLLHSSVPVMVIGAHAAPTELLNQIVFPTEFGPHSKMVFRLLVEMAKVLNAKLTLFHSVPHPTIEPMFQTGVYLLGGSWIPVQAYFAAEVDRKARRIKLWSKWATHQGVETDYELRTEGGPVADTILALAKRKNASLIAMEGQAGRISAALIGSVSRQVLRAAPCPVWVLRYGFDQQKTGPETETRIEKAA
jgi:nucleotide-binding universal stress UspA family protein